MRTAIFAVLAGKFFQANLVHAQHPELKPDVEEGGRRVIKWEIAWAKKD